MNDNIGDTFFADQGMLEYGVLKILPEYTYILINAYLDEVVIRIEL